MDHALYTAPAEPKRAKARNDPALVAAARELRDRWLEPVNAGPMALPSGKYEVSRQLAAAVEIDAGRLIAA